MNRVNTHRIFARFEFQSCFGHSPEYFAGATPEDCPELINGGGAIDRDSNEIESLGTQVELEEIDAYEVSGGRLELPGQNVTLDNLEYLVQIYDPPSPHSPDPYQDLPTFIGLNPNSLLMNRLYNEKYISSKSWGFFSGWIGTNENETIQEGALVLGGYDQSKIDGPFTNFEINDDANCILRLEISDIMILGQSISPLFAHPSGYNYVACIDPSIRSVDVPGSRMHEALMYIYEETFGAWIEPNSSLSRWDRGTVPGFEILRSDLETM